ncbi:single-stranded DNA-binding protein [Streptomyces sp. WM6378]|uniref:single-stranded DNA-binding protein n=1 Tax=Streptomyces sp. WM6378 TaxID=1415557 RepID=UPI0006AF3709|nr:single-stranded DNA-binding protein [Streptomyces sp. WM6378]KOU37647.1 single-stranded DNA-binding protein [Streptomyces sp. WM6378]
MSTAPLVPVSGTVTGDVECRITETGTVIARFRLTARPREWDARARAWRDGKTVAYICTVWRDLARNAAESLTDGVAVLVHGRVTEVRDSTVWFSVDELGISLRQRIAYTEQSLPSPQAAAPISTPQPAAIPAARPAPQPAAAPARSARTDTRPRWWETERSQGWPGFAPASADAAVRAPGGR